MRKLLLLLFLPSLLFSQIKDSSGKLIKFTAEDCMPPSGLLQNLGTLNDTAWLDISGNSNHVDLIASNAFEFDGSTNFINTGTAIIGQKPISFRCEIEIKAVGAFHGIFGCGGYTNAVKGITVRINDSNFLQVNMSDGTTVQMHTTTIRLVTGVKYVLTLRWDGISGNTVSVTVNDILYNFNALTDWVGDSGLSLHIAAYLTSGGRINAVFNYCRYTINEANEKLIPFQVGSGADVYDVKNDDVYTISGTVISTNWVLNNDYHFNILKGFNIIGVTNVPASLLNVGLDVLGNALSNPAVLNGHNGAETRMQQINDLSSYDTDSFWYTGTTPNKVAYSDLVYNTDDYLFARLSTNSKDRLLFYNSAQSSYYVNLIEQCYLGNIKWLIKQ